ncbi:MAG: hypothetical protein ACRCUT_14915, partial [Spirochaetota bacterium]
MIKVSKKGITASLALCAAISMVSCATFSGPVDFVEYKAPKGVKSSEQSSLIRGKLAPYYSEDFTYDSKGNIVKVKQVEYLEPEKKNRKFVVWETEWKVYGETVVPSRVLCNGVEFCTINWQLLNSQNKGQVKQDIRTKYYTKASSNPFSGTYEFWKVDLREYPVFSFISDDKFIEKIATYNVYGRSENNALTLGYDNIVLAHYYFSYKQLASGIAKTYPAGSSNRVMLSNISRYAEADFTFTWKTISDAPCLEKVKFTGNFNAYTSDFDVECSYND